MYSIRTRTTLLMVCAIVVTLAIVTLLSVTSIKSVGDTSSNDMLYLLCRVGEKNLDGCFESVEQAVEMVAAFVEEDLESPNMNSPQRDRLERDRPKTAIPETDTPVTPPPETAAPETDTPVTPPPETDTPVTPPPETGTLVTNPGETDTPEANPRETDAPETETLDTDLLEKHIRRAEIIFQKAANRANGVLTYYYRIDPAFSDTVNGFWYTKGEDSQFHAHEVTDITRYDTEDTSRLVWFTVPKAVGHAVWLPPYITDKLKVRVLSYDVPIYWNGVFIGVVGMEIDYSTIAEQVDHIRLYEHGYAFISEADGNLVCHPYMDPAALAGENRPKPVEGMLSNDSSIRYRYGGVEKQGVWLPLHNGMRLYVTVPVSEINGGWQSLIQKIFVVFVLLLAVFTALAVKLANRITAPLQELTEAAKQMNEGRYDVTLGCGGQDEVRQDEVGVLTEAFRSLIGHLKTYITDLNDRAYGDTLTSVRNQGAFDSFLRDMQGKIENSGETMQFAVGVFDCDNLKLINDQHGHEKGDIYLKNASAMICRVFQHSPVFRTGGDEFTVIIENEDYRNRVELAVRFHEQCNEACAASDLPWEQVRVSMGIDVFDPRNDRTVRDVVRRADKLMYENKRRRKAERQQNAQNVQNTQTAQNAQTAST